MIAMVNSYPQIFRKSACLWWNRDNQVDEAPDFAGFGFCPRFPQGSHTTSGVHKYAANQPLTESGPMPLMDFTLRRQGTGHITRPVHFRKNRFLFRQSGERSPGATVIFCDRP
jgi:hypothetical protein